jgi:hypothetical protein
MLIFPFFSSSCPAACLPHKPHEPHLPLPPPPAHTSSPTHRVPPPPVAVAVVEVGKSPLVLKSGKWGQFHRPLAPGTYTLRVSLAGYVTQNMSFTVPPDGSGTTLSIKLKRSALGDDELGSSLIGLRGVELGPTVLPRMEWWGAGMLGLLCLAFLCLVRRRRAAQRLASGRRVA